jgi:hypothetical protein
MNWNPRTQAPPQYRENEALAGGRCLLALFEEHGPWISAADRGRHFPRHRYVRY